MPDLIRMARSAAALGALTTGFAVGTAVGVVNGNRRAGANVATSLGSELALAAAGVRLEVQGEENLWSRRPAIFVFNHQSQLDVAILGALLRRDFTGVAKKSLEYNPLFGPIGYLTDMAWIDRSNTSAAREALEPVVEALRKGTSIAISPEGTRSDELRPFKKGPFHMALQAGVPMVAVVIRNAAEIMPAHSYVISPGIIDVVILPPFDTSAWSVDTIEHHRDEVHAAYVATLADWPERTE